MNYISLAFTFAVNSTRNKYLIISLRISRLRYRISRIRQGVDWRNFLVKSISKMKAKIQLWKKTFLFVISARCQFGDCVVSMPWHEPHIVRAQGLDKGQKPAARDTL